MTEVERLELKLSASKAMQNAGGGYKERLEAIQQQINREKAKGESNER